MPDLGDDTTMAAAYVPDDLYEAWTEHAEEMDMSTSRYIIEMVEAGRKQIDLDAFAADSLQDLRAQRDDLQNEVERQRERVQELERQLDRTAKGDIVEYVAENPGATATEIIQHVADTVPGRTVGHLDLLAGRALRQEDGAYYVADASADDEDSDSTAREPNIQTTDQEHPHR
jgi:hypothetical protein